MTEGGEINRVELSRDSGYRARAVENFGQLSL